MNPVKSKWPLLFKAKLQDELGKSSTEAIREAMAEDPLRAGLYADWERRHTADQEDKDATFNPERLFPSEALDKIKAAIPNISRIN